MVDNSIIIAIVGVLGVLAGAIIGAILTYYFSRKNLELQLKINRRADFAEKYFDSINRGVKAMKELLAALNLIAVEYEVSSNNKHKFGIKNYEKGLNKYTEAMEKITNNNYEMNKYMYLSLFFFEPEIFVKISNTHDIRNKLLDINIIKIVSAQCLDIQANKIKNKKDLERARSLFKTDITLNDYIVSIQKMIDDYEKSNYELTYMMAEKQNPLEKPINPK